MNKLMQNLEDAKSALTTAMEGGDAEAIKAANEQLKAAKAAIDAANEAEALIKSLGTNDGKKSEAKSEQPVRSLGDYALKHLDLSAVRAGASRSAGTGFGFDVKTYTDAQTSQQILETSRQVVDTAIRDTAIRGLFGSEVITGNALKYFVLGAREDNSAPAPGTVSENGAKPQFHTVEDSKTVTLQKIAGWFYETDELLEDNAFLKSALDARGLLELDNRVNAWLLSTLLGTSGIGTDTYTHGASIDADTIFEAIMTVKGDTGFDADAIVINPADYQTLRLAKDQVSQYYGGGYMYGPYGNGNVSQQPGIWGVNTIITPAITSGTILVGAFGRGGSVISKANSGARIEIVTGDHDDAIYNRVTVVVEERLGLAVRYPKAFVKITEAAA